MVQHLAQAHHTHTHSPTRHGSTCKWLFWAFAARSITTLWCDVKFLELSLHKLLYQRQQMAPSAPLPSPHRHFHSSLFGCFVSCCGRVAHSHPWRDEKSSNNVLRQREGGGRRHMNTQVCAPAWTVITAAATVKRERHTHTPGRSFRLVFIYLSIYLFVFVIIFPSKMNGVTRSLYTFEDIRNQEHGVSYKLWFPYFFVYWMISLPISASLFSFWWHFNFLNQPAKTKKLKTAFCHSSFLLVWTASLSLCDFVFLPMCVIFF